MQTTQQILLRSSSAREGQKERENNSVIDVINRKVNYILVYLFYIFYIYK
jgi:hypothetical protein